MITSNKLKNFLKVRFKTFVPIVGIGTTAATSHFEVVHSNATANLNVIAQKLAYTDTSNYTALGLRTRSAQQISSSHSGSYTSNGADLQLRGLDITNTFSGTVSSGGNGNILQVHGVKSVADFSGTASDAADTIEVLGLEGVSSGSMGTLGTRAHIGVRALASGTAVENIGLDVAGVSDGNVNKGIVIQNIASGANNYALYSSAAAQSYFAGNVGIGTTGPVAKLDVAGEVKFGNTSSTCNGTNEGQQRYNATAKEMEYCNGTVWSDFSPSGTRCGYNNASDDTGIYCKGLNPGVACPSNYTRTFIGAYASYSSIYECIKN